MRNQFIGTVVGELGINPRTLRYYEGQGLLPRPSRTKSGYRVYDSQTGFRIRFIRKAKGLGLTLKEIQAILEIYNSGKPPCRSLRGFSRPTFGVSTLKSNLRSLRGDLRNLLAGWSDRCETDGNSVCPRLEDFAGTTRKTTRILKGG